MKPLTILTLVVLLVVAAFLIFFKEWYALAALAVALLYFILRRLRGDLLK